MCAQRKVGLLPRLRPLANDVAAHLSHHAIGRIFGHGLSHAASKPKADRASDEAAGGEAGGGGAADASSGAPFRTDALGSGLVSRRRPFGKDASLFDYDVEVQPILNVLLSKSIEQGTLEVEEEHELDQIRKYKQSSKDL